MVSHYALVYLFFRKLSNKHCFSGITAALVSSDLCVNSSDATVSDCFWSNEVSQGISVAPKQLIYLNPFVSFPQPPGLIPFSVGTTDAPESSRGDAIYVLLESDLLPTFNREAPAIEVSCINNFSASWNVNIRDTLIYDSRFTTKLASTKCYLQQFSPFLSRRLKRLESWWRGRLTRDWQWW